MNAQIIKRAEAAQGWWVNFTTHPSSGRVNLIGVSTEPKDWPEWHSKGPYASEDEAWVAAKVMNLNY